MSELTPVRTKVPDTSRLVFAEINEALSPPNVRFTSLDSYYSRGTTHAEVAPYIQQDNAAGQDEFDWFYAEWQKNPYSQHLAPFKRSTGRLVNSPIFFFFYDAIDARGVPCIYWSLKSQEFVFVQRRNPDEHLYPNFRAVLKA